MSLNNRLRKFQPLQASQEYIQQQEKGEFMPKNIRTHRVNEIRSSHFNFGNEPMSQKTKENEEFVKLKFKCGNGSDPKEFAKKNGE
jgi:hypothetical protein